MDVFSDLLRFIYSMFLLRRHRRGSPLVEESILLGLALFAFMILASIIFDLLEFAKDIFENVTNGLDKLPDSP